MKKSFIRIVLLLCCFALLTSCSRDFFDPELALKAPNITGKYAEVQEALKQEVDEDIILQYPSVQGINTAFCSVDIDGDHVDEVLVFYKLSIEGSWVQAHLFRKGDDGWKSAQKPESLGVDIEHVEFSDLNGDKIKEVCIGWRLATTQANLMTVYQSEHGELVQRSSELYNKYILCDMNRDGVQELGLAVLDAKKMTSSFTVYTIEKSTLRELDAIALDGSVVSYDSIAAAPIDDFVTGVYIDAHKGVDTMITELIYFKDGKLYNPFTGTADTTNVSTVRYCNVRSQNIDSQGGIEIPFMELLPNQTAVPEQSILQYVISWQGYNGAITPPVSLWWYNTAEQYYIQIDKSWRNRFTVQYNDTLKAYVFFEWTGKTVGQQLFYIKTYKATEWDSEPDSACQELVRNGSTVWCTSVTPNNRFGITYDTLKTNFKMI